MRIGFISILTGLAVAPAACSGSSTSSEPAVAASPTWTGVYSTIVSKSCLPCHATGIGLTTGHLDMSSKATAYANLVNVPAAGSGDVGAICAGHGTRVVPGKPDSSIMYLKVSLDDPAPCGAKMPYLRSPLSQAEVDLIDTWITKGANDD